MNIKTFRFISNKITFLSICNYQNAFDEDVNI